MTEHSQDVVEAIAQAYHVERAIVDAAINKAVAGQVNALLCVGINLSPEQLSEQLPADPAARREFIECKIGEHLNEK
jgi:prophage DNA circulation protein